MLATIGAWKSASTRWALVRAAAPVRILICAIAAIVVLLLIGSPAAHAESLCTDTWVGPAEGNWAAAEDWSSGKAPSASDVACIGSGKTVDVQEGANEVGVLQGEGSLDMSAGSLTIGALTLESSSIADLHVGGGTLSIASGDVVTARSFVFYRATLTGAGTLEVTNSFIWDEKGVMSGSGRTVVGSSATAGLSVGGNCAQVTLAGRTFVNEGTISSESTSEVAMQEGARLENKGKLAIAPENSCNKPPFNFPESAPGPAPEIVNTGQFLKTSGTAASQIGVNFENHGVVEVQSGSFKFSHAASSNAAGSWRARTGAAVEFTYGTLQMTDSKWSGGIGLYYEKASAENVEGPEARVNDTEGASLTVTGGNSLQELALYRSTLNGSGTVTVASSLSWGAGGTMSGSGRTVLGQDATGGIAVGGNCSKVTLAGRTLVNEGTISNASTSEVAMQEGAHLENKGTFEIAPRETCNEYSFIFPESAAGPAPIIVNTGQFLKTSGVKASAVQVDVENHGVVEAQTGSLRFSREASSNSAGNWRARTGAAIEFTYSAVKMIGSKWSGGIGLYYEKASAENVEGPEARVNDTEGASLTVTGTTSVQEIALYRSTLDGAGALAVDNSLVWQEKGTMSGSGRTILKPGASGAVSGGCTRTLTERTFINEGEMVDSSAELAFANGGKMENKGTFVANAEKTCSGDALDVLEGAATIVNTGTFEKTAGAGPTVIAVPFENQGTIAEKTTGHFQILSPIVHENATQYGSLNSSEMAVLRAVCGDPVNCLTGNFYESQTDIAVGGRGVGLDLTRYYNAQAAAASEHGVFGYGWTSSLSDHVVYSESAKTATVVQANGSTVSFSEESGSWKAPVWTQDKLTGNASEGYTLTLADQTVYKFAASGRLESVADRNGNTTSLGYNEKGQLATITDPSGRTIRLAYNSEGLVESATDPMGHTVKYAYESGSLAGVTLPDQSSPRWQFKYDASHRMTSMVNGIGGETTNTYNSNNQVVSQKNPAGHTLKWEYEPFKTKITNESTGSVTLEEYTSADKVNAITHAYGTEHATTESFTYNEAGEPLTHTDGNGHTTIYEYSGGGDRVKQTDPEGHETKWSYNAKHEITSETLPSGEKTSIEYDEHGNPIKVSRPAPKEETQETRYEYNPHGEMTTMIDPVGGKWNYEYDEAGDRTGETDPEGDKTTWSYNEDSQNTSEVSPAGNVEGGKPAEYTTSVERDALGQTVKITRPEGKETSYEYNADGDQTAATDANGHKTEVSYDSEDKPIKVSQPSGATQETEYDGAGQIVKQTDGNKHVTSYVRDVLGQVTEETNPLEHKTKRTYDAAGNLATVTDAAGRTTTYGYNKENRPTKISFSEAGTHTVEYEYTVDGQLASMSDGTGTSSYGYDQLGRLIETKDGHEDVVGYGYDLANEITSVTYPNGKTIKDGYDKAGRLNSVSDWLSHTTSFSYTPDSQVATESFPEASGDSDHYAYSRAGELAETKMLKGAETLAQLLYKRDGVGQVTNATQTGLPGEASTEYAYTTNEQLEKAGSTGYEYDPAGNPTKIGAATNTFNAADQLTEGGGVTYTYNEVGQRTKATPTSGPATSYSYDQAGNLTSVARPEAGETAKIEDSYTYNGNDLRASETINGTTSYLSWQQTGALPLLLSEGSNSYIYGPDGTPIEQINSEEHATYLHHDQAGSTRLLTNEKGETVGSYSYTPYGAIEKHEGTATTALGYDGQYTSADTGLIYLRARTYDPTTAQFLSVDPLAEATRRPYGYANDNPLNVYDPTGLLSIGEVVGAVEKGVSEGAQTVGEGVEASVEFVKENPVIVSAAGCTVGALAGPEVCAGAIAVGYGLNTANNIEAYANGDLTPEQLIEKQFISAGIAVLGAAPAIPLIGSSAASLLEESSAGIQLLVNAYLEAPDVVLALLDGEISCAALTPK